MIKGFHVCKAGNAPSVGQVKSLIVNGDRIKSKRSKKAGRITPSSRWHSARVTATATAT